MTNLAHHRNGFFQRVRFYQMLSRRVQIQKTERFSERDLQDKYNDLGKVVTVLDAHIPLILP